MHFLVAYLSGLIIFCNLACLRYAILVSRLPVTDSWTWRLAAVGFSVRFIDTSWGLWRVLFDHQTLRVLSEYSLRLVLISSLLETIIYVSFLMMMWRKYHFATAQQKSV